MCDGVCADHAMAYVSNDLIHFVGRSLASDALRYELLDKIVNGGVLLDPSHIGRRDPICSTLLVMAWSAPHIRIFGMILVQS